MLTPEQIETIKRPLPPEALKPHPTKSGMTAINAIFVIERLNEVFGIGGWKLFVEPLSSVGTDKTSSKGRSYNEFSAITKVTMVIPAHDIHYECVASSTNEDEGDAYKGSVTDSITKISSWLGIGADVWKNKSGSTSQAPANTTTSSEIKTLSQLETADDFNEYIQRNWISKMSDDDRKALWARAISKGLGYSKETKKFS